jgi:hypothetical protein
MFVRNAPLASATETAQRRLHFVECSAEKMACRAKDGEL